ncbi:MAG TPA: endonuclease III, partial [Casimicrobiaceae bacterium]|nr:endonuclease III [Casimicrobiaceae bacterium]
MNAEKRRLIFERLRAANPNPRSELDYRSPYELLVAVVLSAQATDKGVNKATARLFPVANTPAAFAKLGVDGLIPYVSSIGL